MKKAIDIVIIIVGIVLTSVMTINTRISPVKVNVISNEDVKIVLKENGEEVSNIEIPNKEMLPVHNQGGYLWYSPTLSMDDLVTTGSLVSANSITQTYDILLNKETENVVLEAHLIITGDDALNKAVRVQVQQGTKRYVLSQDNPEVITDVALTTTGKALQIKIYYEMEDESCTFENINAAEGCDIQLELYAHITE